MLPSGPRGHNMSQDEQGPRPKLHPWCESVLARVHIDAGGQYYVSNCEDDSRPKVIVSSTDIRCVGFQLKKRSKIDDLIPQIDILCRLNRAVG